MELDGRCLDGFQFFAGELDVDPGSSTCSDGVCTTQVLSRILPDPALAGTQSAGSRAGLDWWERHGRNNQIIEHWTRGTEQGEYDCLATLPTEPRDCGFELGRPPLVSAHGVEVSPIWVRTLETADLYAPWAAESSAPIVATRDGRTLLARNPDGLITSWPIASEDRHPTSSVASSRSAPSAPSSAAASRRPCSPCDDRRRPIGHARPRNRGAAGSIGPA